MRDVLYRFLEILTGVSGDEMMQPSFQGLELMQFPELHEQSTGQLAAFRQLYVLASALVFYRVTNFPPNLGCSAAPS